MAVKRRCNREAYETWDQGTKQARHAVNRMYDDQANDDPEFWLESRRRGQPDGRP